MGSDGAGPAADHAATDSAARKRGRGGRPKLYGPPLNVPLTPLHRATVDQLAALWRCGAAEAIRRVIDAVEVPEPVERVAVDPAQYDALIDGLAGLRTPLNRINGDLYRLTRDAYAAWSVPEPAELTALREELAAARTEMAALAARVSGLSPW